MRASMTLQDKLVKQNEITQRRLTQELEKLEKVEKSDLRMIETERQRFRSRHKKLETVKNASTSNSPNMHMYETWDSGSCYHCTAVTKESGSLPTGNISKDSYELVRSLLFTNGEVDPDKVLCLHLLAAHTTNWNEADNTNGTLVKTLLEQSEKKSLTGAWNNVLPCYVVDIRSPSDSTNEEMKLHENPLKITVEDETIRYFEQKYKRYIEENSDFGTALLTNAKQTRHGPNGLGRMPIISPHVYSLLGASHELRIKQAMMDRNSGRKFDCPNIDLDTLEEENLSMNLEDNDNLSNRVTTRILGRNFSARPSCTHSKRLPYKSYNFDHRITMLKTNPDKTLDSTASMSRNSNTLSQELVTIKPSFKTMKETLSRCSSSKFPFCNISENASGNSFASNSQGARLDIRKCRKRIYLNYPVKSVELRNNNYRTVPILVNYQMEALVQSVLDVLQEVCPEKLNKIIELARDPQELTKLLARSEMQSFIQSLSGQSLISSPESYVVSCATIAEEIDLRFEGLLEKEIIALTLEVPPLPSLNALILEIRSNIFTDTAHNKNQPNDSLEEIKCSTNDTRCQSSCINNELKMHSVSRETSSEEDPGDSETRSTWDSHSKTRLNSKPRRSSQESNHSDMECIILKRMTNNQRILIGQTCASLKAKRINNEGLINERMPLAALIAPAFSRDSIKVLTRGTIYSPVKSNEKLQKDREEEKQDVVVLDKLTGPVLARIRQDVAEEEMKHRLKSFLQTQAE